MAPSRRITSPLSIGFSTMCTASAPYSAGLPSREGCGTTAQLIFSKPSDALLPAYPQYCSYSMILAAFFSLLFRRRGVAWREQKQSCLAERGWRII